MMQRFLWICGILAFAAMYFLTESTDNDSHFAAYFWIWVIASGVLALVMFSVIVLYITQIIRDKQNRVFGSQIARRLTVMFMFVSALPALFLLGVSAQFISHSINSWFGDDTKQALERSLKLSQSALENTGKRTEKEAQIIRNLLIVRAMQQQDFDPIWQTPQAKKFVQLVIWDFEHLKLEQEFNPQILPSVYLDNQIIHQLQEKDGFYYTETINNILYTSGWLSLPNKYQGKRYVLFFRQAVPHNIAEDAQLIEAAWAKYAELVFAKSGLQTFFLVTLLIAALLAILLGLLIALRFSQRFVAPILSLADGARSVAQSDFSCRIPIHNKDELGQLAGLFNHMIEQLAIAKQSDEQHRQEQEAVLHYLERVLASLSTGVITLDYHGRLNTYNPIAEQLLDINLSKLIGKNVLEWTNQSPQHIAAAEVLTQLIASETQDKNLEITYLAKDESRILLGKAIRLPEENGNGLILVFDNITLLVAAQKEAAWGEVAKRLAHEIRNPLTPIQLSAERLAWKLQDKLEDKDKQILIKSTDTIIKQVAALKEMVEAFRNYARAPYLKLRELNLNALITEVLVLYESSPCIFTANLCKMPVYLKADATAMRQVLHNLLKNAAEAAQSDAEPQVIINTDVDTRGNKYLIVQNNGTRFSTHMLQRAFEPYITDKPTGTGLGLSVVKKIIEDHGGQITLANQEPFGACVSIYFPSIETT